MTGDCFLGRQVFCYKIGARNKLRLLCIVNFFPEADRLFTMSGVLKQKSKSRSRSRSKSKSRSRSRSRSRSKSPGRKIAKSRKPRAKKATARRTAAHPPYIDMITAAITAMKDRGGSSRQAIEKYIKANNRVAGDVPTHLKMALKRGVKSGRLVHTKGTGASGSFKVGKAAAAPKRKPARKKAAAKRPRKRAGTPKKKRATKKTGAKKATKKKPAAKKAKSPARKKAAKKPKAKSAAKKRTKSPKRRAAPKKKAAKKTKAKK